MPEFHTDGEIKQISEVDEGREMGEWVGRGQEGTNMGGQRERELGETTEIRGGGGISESSQKCRTREILTNL